MSVLDGAQKSIRRIDEEADRKGLINGVHPLIKLILTLIYIVLVVMVKEYEMGKLIMFALYPLGLFIIGGFSVREALYRLRFVLPLVIFMGIINAFINRTIVISIGAINITWGMLSFLNLMIKGILTVMSTYLLFVSTGIEKICYALRLIHVPKVLVTEVLLIYRYISLMLDEAGRMTDAYKLRAPGQKGIKWNAWGAFAGNFLLRSIDRAENVYESMLLRGFSGELLSGRKIQFKKSDIVYLISWIGFFIFAGLR